jgi:SynChlorMet cassette radical SAM/SPASM protein ScmE
MRVMRTPKSMDLEITTRCNLRCEYCSHFTSARDVGLDLPKEEWLSFFEELNRCAVMEVQLSGGEPFLRKDLKELIEGIVRNRMRFSILSNGTLISEETAAFLASTRRCNHIQVSIDGAVPATHDSFRGEGSFLKAIAGIRNLLNYRVPVTVRVTIRWQGVLCLLESGRSDGRYP